MAKSRAEIMASLAKLAGGKTPAVVATAPKAAAIPKLEDLPTVGIDPDEDEEVDEDEVSEDVEEFETEEEEASDDDAPEASRSEQHDAVMAEFTGHLKTFIRFIEANADRLIDVLSE